MTGRVIPHRKGPLTHKRVTCSATVEREGQPAPCGNQRMLPVETTGKVACEKCGAAIKVSR